MKAWVKNHEEWGRKAPLFPAAVITWCAAFTAHRLTARGGNGTVLSPLLGITRQLHPPLNVTTLEGCPLATWWRVQLYYSSPSRQIWSRHKSSSRLLTPGKLCHFRAAVSNSIITFLPSWLQDSLLASFLPSNLLCFLNDAPLLCKTNWIWRPVA